MAANDNIKFVCYLDVIEIVPENDQFNIVIVLLG